MPPQRRSDDVDLTGGFRLDLKTAVLLLGLVFSWWDVKQQGKLQIATQEIRDQKNAEIAKVQNENNAKILADLSQRLNDIQAYMSNLKASLAAAGVADVDGRPIRRSP